MKIQYQIIQSDITVLKDILTFFFYLHQPLYTSMKALVMIWKQKPLNTGLLSVNMEQDTEYQFFDITPYF